MPTPVFLCGYPRDPHVQLAPENPTNRSMSSPRTPHYYGLRITTRSGVLKLAGSTRRFFCAYSRNNEVDEMRTWKGARIPSHLAGARTSLVLENRGLRPLALA